MGESYGPFVRFLVISSGLLAAYIGLAMIVSHPLGIAGAAVVFLIWGFFCKVLAFVFAPTSLKTYRGEEGEEDQAEPDTGPLDDLENYNLYDFSRTVERARRIRLRAEASGKKPEAPNRILGPQHEEGVWSRCHQEERIREPKSGFE
jgi:hypothetical protein